jgi:hypothetical protein
MKMKIGIFILCSIFFFGCEKNEFNLNKFEFEFDNKSILNYPEIVNIPITTSDFTVGFHISDVGYPVKFQLCIDDSIIYDSGYIGNISNQSWLDIFLNNSGKSTELIIDKYNTHSSLGYYWELRYINMTYTKMTVLIYAPLNGNLSFVIN